MISKVLSKYCAQQHLIMIERHDTNQMKLESDMESLEVCNVLLGEFRHGVLHAKLCWRRKGTHSSVQFDWAKVLEREECHADVVGFFHTHPEGFVVPSDRDESTMRSWAFSFGKPLACAIETSQGLRAWLFHPDGATQEFAAVERFKPNWIAGYAGGNEGGRTHTPRVDL